MADRERGERIKWLRKEKARREGKQRITQQAMADATGVSLRAAQEWDYGGGIDDDHLPALIKFLGTTADFLLYGPEEEEETPDLMGQLNGSPEERLDRIEQLVRANGDRLDRFMAEALPILAELSEGPERAPPDEATG